MAPTAVGKIPVPSLSARAPLGGALPPRAGPSTYEPSMTQLLGNSLGWNAYNAAALSRRPSQRGLEHWSQAALATATVPTAGALHQGALPIGMRAALAQRPGGGRPLAPQVDLGAAVDTARDKARELGPAGLFERFVLTPLRFLLHAFRALFYPPWIYFTTMFLWWGSKYNWDTRLSRLSATDAVCMLGALLIAAISTVSNRR